MAGSVYGRAASASDWQAPVAVACLTLPWLWPLASGPWPAAQQAIWTLGCAGLLLVLLAPHWTGWARAAATAWLVAAGCSAVIGLIQYFGLSPGLGPLVNLTPQGEAFGNLRQRNQFASLMSIGIAALLWGLAAARAAQPAEMPFPRPARWISRESMLRLVLLALLATAIAASRSRTGLLQLVSLAVLAWVWRAEARPEAIRSVLVLVAAYTLAAMGLPLLLGGDPVDQGIAGRFRAEGLHCGSRIVLWDNVLHLIGQRPWTGWGWGELDYAHFMALYPGERFCEILDNAHNLPLHLAVELGLPAALVACTGMLAWLWRARPWREIDPGRRMGWIVLAVIALHSLLEYPLWYGPFQLAVAAALMIVVRSPFRLVVAGVDTQNGQDVPTAGLGPALRAIGLALMFAAAYAAWDYDRVSQIYTAPERRSAQYRSDTLEKIRDSWLFSNQVQFAELVTTGVTPANARRMLDLSSRMLHFSPEARVVEKLVESAALSGEPDMARALLLRFRSAFPTEAAVWEARQRVAEEAPEAIRLLLMN